MAGNWRAHLPKAPLIRDVTAPEAGHLAAIDGEALGHAVVGLGGGRRVETDRIDPAVGLSDMARLGTKLGSGDLLARIHAASEEAADRAEAALREAIVIGDAPRINDLVRGRVDP